MPNFGKPLNDEFLLSLATEIPSDESARQDLIREKLYDVDKGECAEGLSCVYIYWSDKGIYENGQKIRTLSVDETL